MYGSGIVKVQLVIYILLTEFRFSIVKVIRINRIEYKFGDEMYVNNLKICHLCN